MATSSSLCSCPCHQSRLLSYSPLPSFPLNRADAAIQSFFQSGDVWSYTQDRSSSRHWATLLKTCRSAVAVSASRRSNVSAATIREVPCLLSSRVRRPFVVSKRSPSPSWWYCHHHVHVELPQNSCVLARTPGRSNQFAPFSRNSLASFIFVARYGLPPRSG